MIIIGQDNGMVWPSSGTFEGYMAKIRANLTSSGTSTSFANSTVQADVTYHSISPDRDEASLNRLADVARDTSFWLTDPGLGPTGIVSMYASRPRFEKADKRGQAPLVGGSYKFFRNVQTDYMAKGDGQTDDTEAINAAILDGNRCGQECGNTFTLGAIVYFPVSRLMKLTIS